MRYRTNPDLLRTILPLLARNEEKVNRRTACAISLRKILVEKPYSELKLKRCQQRLETTVNAPAISVARYWLYNADYFVPSNDVYLLEDSIHRVVAARQCGISLIKARIHADYWCKPNMYRLDPAKAMLWRQVDEGWQLVKNELTVEQIQILRLIGVGAMSYGKSTRRSAEST